MNERSIRIRLAVACGIALAACAAALVGATAAGASAKQSPPPVCHSEDVGYYFGPTASDGLNKLHLDVTLIAAPTVTCRLSDKPLLTLGGPAGQKAKVPVVQFGGTGRSLTLSPGSPLHTTLAWANPDETTDRLFVSTLTLRMSGGGATLPSVFPLASGIAPYPRAGAVSAAYGLHLLPWQTGPGQSEGTTPVDAG
jgi:hypothetical protein